MSKISELSDGGSLQSTDYLIAVRSGGNVKVQADGNLTLGTVTADGLTVQTTNGFNALLESSNSYQYLQFKNTLETNNYLGFVGDDFSVTAANKKYLQVEGNGDISFYEDTGTTPKFFWDASAESLGIGTASPAQSIDTTGNILLRTNGSYVAMRNSSGVDAAVLSLNASDQTVVGGQFSGAQTIFRSAIGEAARIDSSGNVGIGETSPLGKLHIKGSDTGATASAQGNSLVLEDSENGLSILSSTAGAGYINFGDSDDNNIGMIVYGHSSNSMNFWTNASERMRIDSSGNVGIGGSPTAFGGGFIVSQTTGSSGGYSLQSSGSVVTQMAADSTASVGYTGTRSNHPHVFTTNNTERMRIDSSGNLLVGRTTSDGYRAALLGSSQATSGLQMTYSGVQAGTITITSNSAMAFGLDGSDGSTERMRIDSSGNLLVGTTSSGGAGGATINASGDTTDLTLYGTNTSFGGRIFFGDSSDRCSIQGKYGSGGGGELEFYTDTSGGTNLLAMRINNSQDLYLFNQSSGAGNADLRYSTSTGQVTYDTSSRLVKDQIQDIPYGLAEVLALSPKKYVRTDTDNQAEVGFIADEVVNIVPDVVGMMEKRFLTQVETDTEVVAGSVQYGKLTAVLVKAIQEQQEIINDLRARVAQLEGV